MAVERGERTVADLADAENVMTRLAIEEQARAGVEILTDGQIRWFDPVSHVAGRLEGVRLGERLRYFETDIRYRQPVLTARPTRRPGVASLLVEEFSFARNALGRLPTSRERAGKLSIKPVLTGPFTLATLSRAETPVMESVAARAEAFTEALAQEFRALVDSGADLIQLDEPAILRQPEQWPVFAEAVARLVAARDEARKAGRKARLALAVYFGDPAPLYEKLAQLPVDVLALDFTSSTALPGAVAAAGSPVALGLGVVNGLDPQMENPSTVARQIAPMLPRIGQQAYLGPSCGLEMLPREQAFAKLQLLSDIRNAL
jgi:5-methyltetrahydropteroyltriglutamate--homocysteine methyltransferase